jgi:hypothetical protein
MPAGGRRSAESIEKKSLTNTRNIGSSLRAGGSRENVMERVSVRRCARPFARRLDSGLTIRAETL